MPPRVPAAHRPKRNPTSHMKQKAYAAAGVDIDLGNKVKGTLPKLLASTHRREVLGKVGGFGGLFALDVKKYRQPVLVSSVDGVGTKLKLAFAMDRHDTIYRQLGVATDEVFHNAFGQPVPVLGHGKPVEELI